MTRTWRHATLGLAGILLAGCGTSFVPFPHQTAAPSSPATQSRSSSISHSPEVLSPTGQVETNPAVFDTQTVRAHLRGSGLDTLTVRAFGTGSGRLTVTNSRGATLWTVNHVSWVGVLEFRHHLPVVITRGDQQYCGTGGCSFASYTYNPGTGHWAPIPVQQPNTPVTYRLQASPRAFVPVPVAGSVGSTLFGFSELSPQGITLTNRLYDALQHQSTQTYGYALNSTPTGEWVPVGHPLISPSGPLSPAQTSYLTPTLTTVGLVSAVALGFASQARALTAPSLNWSITWPALRPLQSLGTTLNWSQQFEHKTLIGSNQEALSFPVYGTVGRGFSTRLKSWTVTATVVTSAGGHAVNQIAIIRNTLAFSRVSQVLSQVMADATTRQYLLTHTGDGVQVVPGGPALWSVNLLVGQVAHPWYQLNAVSGQLTTAP
ncbi:MAG: hypothetical protein M0Z53_02325 [Thermaerobacter sp.]|nr:hypothetical protein [Thermaerobacter sp.]